MYMYRSIPGRLYVLCCGGAARLDGLGNPDGVCRRVDDALYTDPSSVRCWNGLDPFGETMLVTRSADFLLDDPLQGCVVEYDAELACRLE